jgi:hypothetical protein
MSRQVDFINDLLPTISPPNGESTTGLFWVAGCPRLGRGKRIYPCEALGSFPWPTCCDGKQAISNAGSPATVS